MNDNLSAAPPIYELHQRIAALESELTRTEYERHMTALERDGLRAELAAAQARVEELARDVLQWQINSRENKLIAEQLAAMKGDSNATNT